VVRPRGPISARDAYLPWIACACLGLFATACNEAVETPGRSIAALGYPNDQPAFDYFRGKGLTAVQAAGIVGNLDQESGVNPAAVQSGGPGRGIAQWSVGGRWDTITGDNVLSYATQQGQSSQSLQLQLDFIWYELTTFPAYGLAALMQATNVTDATTAFQNDFEVCGACASSQRIADAQNVLNSYGADVVDGGQLDGPAPPSCTVSTTHATGQCLDVAACAALGNHVSTPGFCPGPKNIECCTSTASDAGSPTVDGGETGDLGQDSDASPTGGGGSGCSFSGTRGSPAVSLVSAMLILLGYALLLLAAFASRREWINST
jgi:hypothetical protein